MNIFFFFLIKNQCATPEWIADTEIPCFDLEIITFPKTQMVVRQLECRSPRPDQNLHRNWPLVGFTHVIIITYLLHPMQRKQNESPEPIDLRYTDL